MAVVGYIVDTLSFIFIFLVTVAEWMQPRGVEKYGSDGSIFIVRIQWKRKNRLFTD